MVELSLTSEEQQLRSFYLNHDTSWFTNLFHELRYVGPGIVFAALSLFYSQVPLLLVGFAWVFSAYLYRVCSRKWTVVAVGLMEKYEARIGDLEAQLEGN